MSTRTRTMTLGPAWKPYPQSSPKQNLSDRSRTLSRAGPIFPESDIHRGRGKILIGNRWVGEGSPERNEPRRSPRQRVLSERGQLYYGQKDNEKEKEKEAKERRPISRSPTRARAISRSPTRTRRVSRPTAPRSSLRSRASASHIPMQSLVSPIHAAPPLPPLPSSRHASPLYPSAPPPSLSSSRHASPLAPAIAPPSHPTPPPPPSRHASPHYPGIAPATHSSPPPPSRHASPRYPSIASISQYQSDAPRNAPPVLSIAPAWLQQSGWSANERPWNYDVTESQVNERPRSTDHYLSVATPSPVDTYAEPEDRDISHAQILNYTGHPDENDNHFLFQFKNFEYTPPASVRSFTSF